MKTLALLSVLLSAGCASMVNGRMQNVPVTSTPPHAAITLACPGEEPRHAGYTPATIVLRRADEGCEITLSKLGYYEETIRFYRRHSVVTALDVVPGVAIGAVGGLFAYLGSLTVLPEPVANDIGESAFQAGVAAPFAADERSGAAFEQVPDRVSVRLAPRP